MCIVCSFCGKGFGTHGVVNNELIELSKLPVTSSQKVVIANRTVVKCFSGKICKGHRGLKMHQRSCQVINGLNNELCEDLEEKIQENNTELSTDNDQHIFEYS